MKAFAAGVLLASIVLILGVLLAPEAPPDP